MFSRMEPWPPADYIMPSSQPGDHTHTCNIIQAEKAACMYLGTHICMFVTTTKEKSKGRAWEGWRGKGRGYGVIIISKAIKELKRHRIS